MGMFVLYLGLHDSMDIITKLGYLASGASSNLGTFGIWGVMLLKSEAGSDPGLSQNWGFLFLGLLISGTSNFWDFLFLRLVISGIALVQGTCPFSWDFTNAALFAFGATSDFGTLGIWGITLLGLPQIPGFLRTGASYFLGFLFLGLLISGAVLDVGLDILKKQKNKLYQNLLIFEYQPFLRALNRFKHVSSSRNACTMV